MTSRLPSVGGDNNNWGMVLNDFLSVAHNADGTINEKTIPALPYNVKDYGAVGDGVTDDTAAINSAVTAIPALGGTLFFPVGQYLVTSTITISKPVALRGVPVMRHTTLTNFQYEAGSCIIANDNIGITAFFLTPNTGSTTVDDKAPSIESLHFRDSSASGYKNTLLHIALYNHVRVRNCSFARGAFGIVCDAVDNDASWCDFNGNIFAFNTIGFLNTATSTGGSVPTIELSGGAFLVGTNQIGFQNDRAVYVRIHHTKFDVHVGSYGVHWVRGGGKSVLTGCCFELNGDNTTKGIYIDPSPDSTGVSLTIIAPQMNGNTGTEMGIDIKGGPSGNYPTRGVQIIGGTMSGVATGILVETGCTAVIIDGVSFNSTSTAAIQLNSGSYNHLLSNIVTDVDLPAGIIDNSSGTTMRGYSGVNGGSRWVYDGFYSAPKQLLVDNTQHNLTGTTTETTVFTGTIKAGTLGPNGSVDFDWFTSCNNNANNKIIKIKFNGNVVAQLTLATSLSARSAATIRWRNSNTTVIVGPQGGASGTGYGVSGVAFQNPTTDNTADIAVTITLTLANTADNIALESFRAIGIR